jgi:glycosyltransferase involved in cell wall biosynthesis
VKPNLLLAGNHLSSHGGSRGPIEDLAERLAKQGYSCLCVSRYRNGLIRGADLLSATVIHRSRYDIGFVDLYSGRAFLWGEAISTALQLLGRPFVVTLHGGGLPEFARTRGDRVRRCLARASAVTAPSRYLLEQMSPYRSDIRLLPNPIDLSTHPFRHRDKAALRLVWVRAFHKIYNPQMAARAMALLPDADLTMIGGDRGDGSLRDTVAIADKLGVADRMRFTGAVKRDQVSSYLQSADIFVNTTNYDNTPVSVIEAMACGLCVVSTSAGGVGYLIEDGVDGLLVRPDDAKSMAEAVRAVSEDPGLAARLSRNARAKVEKFDWTYVLPQWEQLLSSILGVQSSTAAASQCVPSNS